MHIIVHALTHIHSDEQNYEVDKTMTLQIVCIITAIHVIRYLEFNFRKKKHCACVFI